MDPAARARLDRVDAVDGEPADLRAALRTADGEELSRRLEELATEPGDATGGPAPGGDPRAAAREITAGRRYTGTDVPRPFARPLAWAGERVEAAFAWIDRRLEPLPGPPGAAQVALAVLVLLAATVFTARHLRRRSAAETHGRRRPGGSGRDDPAALEREAAAAEAAGDWERAVRLRFRAGLLRLGEREVVAYRPSLTTGEVARALRSPAFDALGADFDRIAYGGAPAGPEEAHRQREAWRSVLEEAGRAGAGHGAAVAAGKGVG